MAGAIIDATIKFVDKFTGPMNEAIEKMQKYSKQTKKMSNDIEKAGKSINKTGKTLATSLKPAVEEGLALFTNLDDDTKKAIISIAGIVAAAGPPLKIIGGLTSGVGGMVKGVSKFGSTAKKSIKAFDDMKNLGKLGNTFKKFGNIGKMAFMGLTNPATIVIGVITAIAVTAFLLINNWGKVKVFFDGVKNKFISVFNSIKKIIQDNKQIILSVAGVLLTVFGPALLISAGKATIAGAKIAVSFVKNLVSVGKQAAISGAEVAFSFAKNVAKAGVQAAITGANIVKNLVKSMITYAAQGWKTVAVIGKQIALFIAQKAAIVGLKAIQLASAGATAVMTAAQWLLNKAFIASPIGWIVLGIGALIAVGVLLYKNWAKIKIKAGELWTHLMNVFGGVGAWFGGIWNTVESSFKSFINFIISGLNKIPQALNSINITVPGWVPGVGGKTIGFNIPSIPYLAKGTNNWRGGLAITQEAGGEIMDLPKGTRVYPNDVSVKKAYQDGAKSKSGGLSINIQKLADKIEVRNDRDIDLIAERLADKLNKIIGNGGGKVEFA